MSDLMSQKEIDALISGAIGSSSQEEKEETEDKKSKVKTFKSRENEEKRGFRYPTTYQSPIINRENYIFNPNPKQSESEEKPVVRSLENYVEFKKYHPD